MKLFFGLVLFDHHMKTGIKMVTGIVILVQILG